MGDAVSTRRRNTICAIGQHIRVGDEPTQRAVEVVGIVGDVRLGDIRLSPPAAVYRPILQEQGSPMLEVRTAGDPAAVAGVVRSTVQSFGHHFAPFLSTADEQINQYLLQERVTALLASGFAGLAVVLAYVGVFGLLAHAVARRTRELGIHIALGATREAVRWMVLRDGPTVSLLGVGVGGPLAVAGARFVRTFLHGVSPFDPMTLALAVALFLAVGGVAGLLPA